MLLLFTSPLFAVAYHFFLISSQDKVPVDFERVANTNLQTGTPNTKKKRSAIDWYRKVAIMAFE